MPEPTFHRLRRTGVYEVLAGGRVVGTVTCTDDDSRTWVARLGLEERPFLDSQGAELTWTSRQHAAEVLVAAADIPDEVKP